MSERYNAKRLRREIAKKRAIAQAEGITGKPATVFVESTAPGVINADPRTIQPLAPQLRSSLICRLHGQPWRHCFMCSTQRPR